MPSEVAGPSLLRRVVYFALLGVGFSLWLPSVTVLGITAYIATLGARVIPNYRWSNCWIFAMQLYIKEGGYIIVRASRDIRVLRRFTVPHAMHAKVLPPDMQVRMFSPTKRDKNQKWMPLKAVCFKGRVIRRDPSPEPQATE